MLAVNFFSLIKLYRADSVEVYLGAQDLTADEPNRIGFTSYELVIHPQFNANTLANDIGLIKLPVALRFNGKSHLNFKYIYS